MKKFQLFAAVIFLSFACKQQISSDNDKINKQLIEKSSTQLEYSIGFSNNNSASAKVFPRSLTPEGELRLVSKKDWTSGFYPGVLWLMYDLSNDDKWKDEALKYTTLLEDEQFNNSDHDIGFKMMSSYGHAYRFTGNKAYRKILIQSARTLITRFNPKIGCIRSWDHHEDKWEYPVIIDNMMNLELLFWAWNETGDPVFFNIAVKHAETTMKNHFRNNYSSYHVINYDTITGQAKNKCTHQGFSDESSWARGQAWALYGYVMTYRESKNPMFLQQAEKIANYILNMENLPSDFIPYWDFSVPEIKKEPRDVSAATIIASALYELSTYSKTNKDQYLKIANSMILSLSSKQYFNKVGSNFGFLLKHSTGSKPKGSEIDVPLIYADYYFLEALKRKQICEREQLALNN